MASGLGLIWTPLDDHLKLDGNAGREWVPAVWPGLAAACAAHDATAARAEPASSAHTAVTLRSVRRLSGCQRMVRMVPASFRGFGLPAANCG